MAKLYVMNCKKQDEVFSYRIMESRQLMTQTIPKGGQLQVYRDADIDTLMHIVEQHRKYGMVDAADIDRTKLFINLCYQIDKPFSPNQIMYGFQHNTDVLTERGKEQRDKAAVAISGNLEQVAQDMGGRVRDMDLQVMDDTKGDTNTGLDEKIIVDRVHGGKPGSKRKAGKSNARA